MYGYNRGLFGYIRKRSVEQYTLVLTGANMISIPGQAEYTAVLYDSQGVVVEGVEFEWSFLENVAGVGFEEPFDGTRLEISSVGISVGTMIWNDPDGAVTDEASVGISVGTMIWGV